MSNAVERTLSIIKPDATKRNLIGEVITKLESGGLKVLAIKTLQLTRIQAEEFYDVHKERPFFADLVNQMIAGPVVIMVLEGPSAIATNRRIMGETDPKKAATGTIRSEYGLSIGENSVHGSDSHATALHEIAFFFSTHELL